MYVLSGLYYCMRWVTLVFALRRQQREEIQFRHHALASPRWRENVGLQKCPSASG